MRQFSENRISFSLSLSPSHFLMHNNPTNSWEQSLSSSLAICHEYSVDILDIVGEIPSQKAAMSEHLTNIN